MPAIATYYIKSTPGSYFSAHGDLIFTVYDGTNVVNTNFKYIAYVFVNGNLIARLARQAQPTTKIGVFNIGDIVRNYVQAVFNPTPNALRCQESGANEFNVSSYVEFAEEYGGNEYPAAEVDRLTDSARVYFNHYNGRLTGRQTNLSAYTDAVLSVRPSINTINAGDNYCFIPYFPTNTSSYVVQVDTYLGNTLYATKYKSYTPSASYALQLLNVAPFAINAEWPNTINTAAHTKYVVTIGGYAYTFNINCENVYTVYTVHFLNRFGGFESRNFTKLSRKSVDITKTDFGKLPFTVDASGNVNYYNSNNVYNETRSVYASQYKEKMTLNTDVLTDEEYLWLGDLFLSPLVYIEMNGYFIPFAITANNYEYKKWINDKITNIQMDIEFGEQYNAQYR